MNLRPSLRLAVFACVLTAAGACSSANDSSGEGEYAGRASAKGTLSRIPSSIHCITLTIEGGTQPTTTSYEVSTSSIDLVLEELPVAPVVKVHANAYSEACSEVTAASVPAFTATSSDLNVSPGDNVHLALNFQATAPSPGVGVPLDPVVANAGTLPTGPTPANSSASAPTASSEVSPAPGPEVASETFVVGPMSLPRSTCLDGATPQAAEAILWTSNTTGTLLQVGFSFEALQSGTDLSGSGWEVFVRRPTPVGSGTENGPSTLWEKSWYNFAAGGSVDTSVTLGSIEVQPGDELVLRETASTPGVSVELRDAHARIKLTR